MLSGLMKLLWFLGIEEEQFMYGEDPQKLMILPVYAGDGRSPQISCFGAALQTAAAKRQAQKELDALNIDREIKAREEWELVNGIHRLRIRPNCGRKPTFKFTVKTGKLVRRGKGGVDWYRYQKEVLLAKLFPFIKECLESRPNTVVLEDGAPAHTHFYQQELYNIHKINRLLWPGNSPDLNMIEPAWMWLK
uniref:Tc1-like transposase DDE domain-containing protein n=1 Tax=Coccidioides posadasii RMSCC 3488 TaxID=454284 RepID=A0A0J6FBY2_COCPO|nr:hypothetical protein CPAG_02798 [Coccidioides posadasii RMSCC 3488]